ncbi:TIGR02687 family protein [Parazoarcus communis]|uniref:TIGR02687 family protein n=1 Tax=Parazoarcus communis TaxID=41977 RepID=A0A2U8H356_9RHOO|nr:BREX-1 system phosphatase PglZ type A [Parazoarcus communis]AWI80387.1 TIGR02687 family protein [Parazoarcus communis]
MSHQRIIQALEAQFATQRVLFWDDPEGEFSTWVDTLELDDVRILRLDRTPALQIKLDVERAPRDRWLLYSPVAEPEPGKDWLLDLRLRGKAFRADSTSMLLDDLGLTTQALRPYLKTRAKFLRAKERVERLRRIVVASDDADALDRKMLAVLVRAEQSDFQTILLKVLTGMVQDDTVDFETAPRAWQEVVANELDAAFWALARRELGYRLEGGEGEPSLRDLLYCILVTDFCRTLSGAVPAPLKHFVLPDRALAANASVFAGRWRSDIGAYQTYNRVSDAVASEIGLGDVLDSLTAEQLTESMTFSLVERRILKDLKDRVLSGAGSTDEAMQALIARRRDGHWANRLLAQTSPESSALVACYDAVEAGAAFLDLKAQFKDGFSFASAEAGLSAYQRELFRFDQLYRYFHFAADAVEPMGWAVLHELRSRIEDIYTGWFLPQLGAAWDKVVEGESGLLSNWTVAGMPNQHRFFDTQVAPLIDAGTKRVFVVISDAFRFEAAEELVLDLNSRSRFKASLSAQLGVLPSYTALGMAALLPHQSLAYKTNSNLDVLADGLPVSTLEQRSALLGRYDGLAIKSDELLALGKDKGRALVRDRRVLYVYHDHIDALGDKQTTEGLTFKAVDEALAQISQIVGFIINSLNGSTVLVTADHGFIYQEAPLVSADKSALDIQPEGTLKAKKRYLLGQGIGKLSKAWCGNTAVTAGTLPEASLDFWVPKGASRFHFAGGARFVHGSAMPQEIVVPVITVRESESDKEKTRAVEFSLLGASNKVVTNTQRFEFIQTEAVSERVLPRTVIVALRDGERPISNEQTLTFDSTSQLLDERKKSVFLTVLAGNYDKTRDYWLTARDSSTKVEALRVSVRVDLAFSNDF